MVVLYSSLRRVLGSGHVLVKLGLRITIALTVSQVRLELSIATAVAQLTTSLRTLVFSILLAHPTLSLG